jgi:hypothetical protein
MGIMMFADFACIDILKIHRSYVNVLLINTVSFGLLLNYSVFPNVRVFQKNKHIKISKCLIVFMVLFLAATVLCQMGEIGSRLAGVGSIAMLFESLTLIKFENGGIVNEEEYEKSVPE